MYLVSYVYIFFSLFVSVLQGAFNVMQPEILVLDDLIEGFVELFVPAAVHFPDPLGLVDICLEDRALAQHT